MQPSEPPKRSPWGLRFAGIGGLMLFLGAMLLSSQASTLDSSMDPREQHHGEPNTGAGTFALGQLNDSCYRFYQPSGEPVMDVKMHRVEGSSLVGEPLEENPCLLDWQAMATDGTEFVQRSAWTLNSTGEYALVVSCESDCSETSGYLMSIDDLQAGLLSSTWLVVGGAMCCLGVLTTPLALLIYFASKPSKAPRVMMVGPEGQLIPITDVNPEHPTLFVQPVVDPPVQQTVAPPFADTAEQQPSEEFVDGLSGVASGSLLTTEQVYALMRGDVEGAQDHARTGRYQSTTAEDTIQNAANAAAIASWDEGVPLAEPQPVQRKISSVKRPIESSEPSTTDAWKDWDEQ